METSPARLSDEEVLALADDPVSLETRDDAEAIIPQLPSQSFVRIARRLRDEQRLELLIPHATAEQLQATVDFEGWAGDRIRVPRIREWLSVIAECFVRADYPRGRLTELMHDMDMDMWVLGLMAATAVAEADPEDDAWLDRAANDMDALETWETPDGQYLVGVPDNEIGRATLRVLDAIYADSLAEGAKVVRYIKYGLGSELEEQQLRWRSGRMADLGFPEWEEAMRLFKPLAREEALGPEAPSAPVPPEGFAEPALPWRGSDLLRAVMAHLEPEQHGVRSREFLLLVNELMAAQRFDPGDDDLQERAIHQARSTVSLGLELLAAWSDADDKVQMLAERLQIIGVRGAFRVGYGPLAKLRRAALALHRSGRVSLETVGGLLDRPWGPSLAGLCHWFPELPVDTEGRARPRVAGLEEDAVSARKKQLQAERTVRAVKLRPLTSMQDVAVATKRVAEAGALAELVFGAEGFDIDPSWVTRVDEPARLRLGDLVRTALVRSALPGGDSSRFAPLSEADLDLAARSLLDARGELSDEVSSVLEQVASNAGVDDHLDALGPALLSRLNLELATLEYGEREDGSRAVDLTRTGGLLTVQRVSMWLSTGVDGNEKARPG